MNPFKTLKLGNKYSKKDLSSFSFLDTQARPFTESGS